MPLREHVAVALESLWGYKARTILALLGVLVAVAAVVILFAITASARTVIVSELTTATAGRFNLSIRQANVVGEPVGSSRFTAEDVENVQGLPGVRMAVASQVIRSRWQYGNQDGVSRVIGTRYLTASAFRYHLDRGRWFSVLEERDADPVAVVGADWAANVFGTDDPIGKTILLEGVRFTVIGVVREFAGILNDLTNGGYQAQDLYIPDTDSGRLVVDPIYNLIQVDAISEARRTSVTNLARQVLSNLHPGTNYDVYLLSSDLSHAKNIFRILTEVVISVTGVALSIGGIGIANVMLMAVKERTFEIGVRKAIGARRRDILLQFLVEAVVISLLGGALGTVVAAVVLPLAAPLVKIPITLNWLPVLMAEGVAVVTGLLAGAYPAYKAAKLEPVQALATGV